MVATIMNMSEIRVTQKWLLDALNHHLQLRL